MLIENKLGHYRFLKGIGPYSCGVVADPGWEIVRASPPAWIPWREGFAWVDSVLKSEGLPRSALCAVELRSPQPFSMEGFVEFNRGYCAVLEQWKLILSGLNPIARTNVAPVADPPASPSLHAFSFVRANSHLSRPTFVVAGAGELLDGTLDSNRIVQRGETSSGAMLEKAAYVLDVMEERQRGLGVSWNQVTTVDIYTIRSIDESLRSLLLDRIGPAARYGLCWQVTRPPVLDIEFEMDVRGLACELSLSVS